MMAGVMTCRSRSTLFALALLLAVGSSAARGKDLDVALAPAAPKNPRTPALPAEFGRHAFQLDVQDLREGASIGKRLLTLEQTYDVRASVADFARALFEQSATAWGLRIEAGATRVLTVSIERLFVTETAKAMGARYEAEVDVTFTLAEPPGQVLWKGKVSSRVSRFGKGGAEGTYSKLLSEALWDAFATFLETPELQQALRREDPQPP